MKLTIKTHEVDSVIVVELDGRIVLGEEMNALRETVKRLITEGMKKIVLDMEKVSFIDSSGLGTLVSLHSSARVAGASLRLCNVGSRFKELLQITKLLTVFEVSPTEADAVLTLSK